LPAVVSAQTLVETRGRSDQVGGISLFLKRPADEPPDTFGLASRPFGIRIAEHQTREALERGIAELSAAFDLLRKERVVVVP
jgi:hypothetical protein